MLNFDVDPRGDVLLEGRLHVSRVHDATKESRVIRRHAKSLVPPASSGSRVLYAPAPPTTHVTSEESNRSIEHGTDHATNSTSTASTSSTAKPMHPHHAGTSTPVRSDHDADDAAAGNSAIQQQQQNETELIESRLVVSRSAGEAIDVSETSHFVHSAFMNTRIGPATNASSESSASSSGHASRSLSCRLLSVCHPLHPSLFIDVFVSLNPFVRPLYRCLFLALYRTLLYSLFSWRHCRLPATIAICTKAGALICAFSNSLGGACCV